MKKTIFKNCVIVLFALFTLSAIVSFLTVTQKASLAYAEAPEKNASVYGVQSFAEEGNDYESYLGFTLINNGTEYKVRATDKTLTDISIPSIHNGLPVTEIYDNGFMSCRNLKKVFIPSSVNKIGTNAFYNCSSLERVYGAVKVKSIGNSAFSGCINLKYFCIYDSITAIGSNVFRNVTNNVFVRMKEVEFAEIPGINSGWATGRANSSQIIYGKEQICEPLSEEGYKLIQAQESKISTLRTGETGVFYCSEEKDGELIPITRIEPNAFEAWENESLKIEYDERTGETGYKVYLEQSAFANMQYCVNLEINVDISIEEGEGEEKIYSTYLFMGSQVLETVTMPDDIEEIPEGTFIDCISLTALKYCGSTSENILSDKIKYIGDYAFSSCYSMSEIYIPSSVSEMGGSVFFDWGKENYMTGEVKEQTINFDSYLPPDSTNETDPWDNEMGDSVIVNYKTKSITLDTRGGIGGTKEVEAMYGRYLDSVEAPKPSNEYIFEFGGYFTQENGGGTQYYDNKMNSLGIWGREEIDSGLNILYAHWPKKDIPIKLMLDDDTLFLITTVKHDDYFNALDESEPIKTGYEFKGFYSERNGEGIKFYDSELNPTENTYTDLSIEALYAYWTPIRYRVSLLPGNGGGGTQLVYIAYQTTDVYLNKGDSEPVLYISAPKRQHYVFAGFALEDGTLYFSGEEVDGEIVAKCIKALNSTEIDVLYAVWTPIDYTITYYGYAGSETPKSTINADEITNDYNGSFQTQEVKIIKEGIKTYWPSKTITVDTLADVIIKSETKKASIDECYDASTDRYQIWYPSQLYEVRTVTSGRLKQIVGKFELMRDLDLSEYSNWIPFHDFAGTFEGHSHKISGMNINVVTGPNLGLFAINSGTIMRLTVSGTIKVSGSTTIYAGLLCGNNSGRIENCYTEKGSSYSITSTSDDSYIGGLVGLNSGIIYKATNSADIYGQGNIGGVVGKNEGSVSASFISSSSNTGKIYAHVKTNVSIGGIVAVMTGGTIEGCVSAGAITIYGVASPMQILSPRAGKVVGTYYRHTSSYGTQLVVISKIEVIGTKMVEAYIGEDIGETI